MACHTITYMHIACVIASSCETACLFIVDLRKSSFCAKIIFAGVSFGACRPNLWLLLPIIEKAICDLNPIAV